VYNSKFRAQSLAKRLSPDSSKSSYGSDERREMQISIHFNILKSSKRILQWLLPHERIHSHHGYSQKAFLLFHWMGISRVFFSGLEGKGCR
jgi:hypothetical protein